MSDISVKLVTNFSNKLLNISFHGFLTNGDMTACIVDICGICSGDDMIHNSKTVFVFFRLNE